MTTGLDSDRLGILVHEVRSPVAALSAIAETLAEGGLEGDARRSLVKLVTLACRGIERIVTDAAVASIQLEPVDVVGLVRDVVAAARLRGAAVELRIENDLLPVQADPSRLSQALDNLLVNALVHGGSDDPVLVAVAADTMVRITVSDTGPGIARDELERIFEARVRLDPDASEGAGLGLALGRAIAEGHGGSLTVSSSRGAGATFTLSLPFAAS
jgi:two-component system, OmpR family, sensor kinase